MRQLIRDLGSHARAHEAEAAPAPCSWSRVAAAPLDGEPTMADVSIGCVVEIPSVRVFLAERGAGVVEGPPVRLSANQRCRWSPGATRSCTGRSSMRSMLGSPVFPGSVPEWWRYPR